jgi:hypothetical protein
MIADSYIVSVVLAAYSNSNSNSNSSKNCDKIILILKYDNIYYDSKCNIIIH